MNNCSKFEGIHTETVNRKTKRMKEKEMAMAIATEIETAKEQASNSKRKQ